MMGAVLFTGTDLYLVQLGCMDVYFALPSFIERLCKYSKYF